MIVQRDGKRVRLFTRNGHDWSGRYPLITEAALRNKSSSFVVDGEAVLLGVDGVSDFDGLHSRKYDDEVQLYAFDVLALDGDDLRSLPLSMRKTNLARLLARRPEGIFTAPFEQGDRWVFCCAVVVIQVGQQRMAQMAFAEHHDMIKAFPADWPRINCVIRLVSAARASAGSSDHAGGPTALFDRPPPNRSICCDRGRRLCRYPLLGIAVWLDMRRSPILVVRTSACTRKRGSWWRSILQGQIEKHRKRRKCLDADKRLSCQKPGIMACRPVEHPRRNFQPTVCLRSVQGAAKNDMVSLVDSPMNANSAIKPRMMPIKNLAKNGPVGILKPRCTMARVLTYR